ncbi:MAG: hypothetical protein A2252_02460 [Elusimicrobia bacterium RIFOXYA2_FULL_39_19]|nr:MAG: hypothetical protein A2252_02460 [Elusimicrobia bacterium RIFOXYA2_FULL_39_19]
MINKNPYGQYPRIAKSAYIHPAAVIIGNVIIGKQTFVGPGAVIRADEPGTTITIGHGCNIQDRVVVHSLQNSSVIINDETSLSHGCIVHGPCKIGKNCFIGFGAVVFNATLGSGVIIKQLSVVEQTAIPANKLVDALQLINDITKAKNLPVTGNDDRAFVKKVIAVNKQLVKGYCKS